MFAALRSGSPVTLPPDADATLRRLQTRAPGDGIVLNLSEARRIGPRSAGLYLVAGRNGICVVRHHRGACSDDLAAIADHGVRFTVPHQRKRNGDRPIDLYGALPDALSTVSVMVDGATTVQGTNARHNGYRISLPARILWMLILHPTGGAATLGPLGT
jgi:hypothetical protein